mmetsp:Transcript_96324/g.242670  ORF Transcript_96324/g.242670 Transcript_96324/m.242670 type:complete len:1035 (+) Transcript_96324:213-3317(+)
MSTDANSENWKETAGSWGNDGKSWDKPARSASSWGGNQAQGDRNDQQNKPWSKWDDGQGSNDRGWQKKSWPEWGNKKSDWDNKKSDWDGGNKSWRKDEENDSKNWWDKKNKSSWSDDWKGWRRDGGQENKQDWKQDWRQSWQQDDAGGEAAAEAAGPSARELARLLDAGDGPWGARKRSRSPHRAKAAFVPKAWPQKAPQELQQEKEQQQEQQPEEEKADVQANEEMEEEEEEELEGAHPVVQFLPFDLRKEVPLGTAESMVAHCLSLREEMWPDFNLIGGGPSGNPDLQSLRELSKKLQDRIEHKMQKPLETPPPGADHTAIFARANHLSDESEAAIRALPEAARLRVLKAGPIVGMDKDATAMSRARKALAGLQAAEHENHSLKNFIADNFLGQVCEKMIKSVSPEVQMMVMQKGPCLGPCPSQEMFARVDAAEEKIKEDEAKRQAEEEEEERRKAEEKERKAKAREAEFARAPWQSTVISRRMPSVCHAQRSADAWSALVKRRASVIGTYAESQGTQNRARYLAVWPMALQFFGITERTRTMRVCSGFRVALLKSIDTLVSIELVNYMGGDPIFRSPEIFEAVVGGFVTSASVKVAKLNTGMVTDTVLKNIVTTCPQLEALDLRKACLSDSGSVALILKTCTTLRGLKLSFPYLSECPQSNTWHHAAIDALAASPGAHLIELAIEGFSAAIASRDPISSDNPESEELQLGAAALSRLLMCHGASLLSLSLASWPLSDELGLEIGKRCPNLQVLNISSPRKLGEDCSLSPAGLSWIADGCSHLKAVSLRKAEGAVSEDSLATLSRNCQDLVELDLSGCWDEWSSPMYTVTDAVLQAATSCGMTKLEVLDLYMTETSDLTLFALAATCPGLRRLDISTSASDVEGEGYLCPRDAEARTFTDEGLAALARGCHRLEWLNIHMCLRLTDKAIAALADHCRQLSYLDMSGANMDEGYQAFLVSKGAKPKPQMVGQYTDTSMLALKAACPALRRLNVASCPNICSSSLSDLQASRPGLEVQTTRIGRESCLELLLNG